jgi:hypothetical protein
MLSRDVAVSQIAKVTGLSRQIVYRIHADPAAWNATLAAWGGVALPAKPCEQDRHKRNGDSDWHPVLKLDARNLA